MRGEGCRRELDVQLALHEVSTAQGGGHKSLQTIALQPAAREPRVGLSLARRCLSKGLRQGEQGFGAWLSTGVLVRPYLFREQRLRFAGSERDDTTVCEKQQAAAPYLAPVPGRGGCSILVAQGGGVGCVCLGVRALPELQRPLSAPSC